MDSFGRSGDEADVEEMFNFTVDDVVDEVNKLVRSNRERLAS
ncbi:hypothetical protein [Companilactobacillus nodensis]|nr:hypothetical protein [Companilactobacillus nodensis]